MSHYPNALRLMAEAMALAQNAGMHDECQSWHQAANELREAGPETTTFAYFQPREDLDHLTADELVKHLEIEADAIHHGLAIAYDMGRKSEDS